MADPTAAQAFAAGVQSRAAGDTRGAASSFLMAFAMAPDEAAYRRAAFDVLNVMSGYRSLPPMLITALENSVTDVRIDVQPLSLVVRNLLQDDPRLSALSEGDIESALAANGDLLTIPLLLAVLGRAVNISTAVETMAAALRRHLCLCVASGRETRLLTLYRAFTIAMAQQCITNRYAWQQGDDERAAVAILAATDDADALLVRASYQPLSEISASAMENLPPEIADQWRDEAEERERAAQLPAFTPLSAGLSDAMRAQYESFPYPRWRQLHVEARVSLRDLLRHTMPNAHFNAALDGAVDILIAGCGTGQSTLPVALGLANAQVTAVDLSRTSLAYAARMAKTLGATNVTFGVADILNLGALPQRFHMIECGGVLHHMADPAAGLRVLRDLLRPEGVMMIALYSERGRVAEAAAQRFVQDEEFPDSAEGLRAARAALLALPDDHPARPVADTPDFFTLDGLHDLIFNVHESRITPAGMKRLLTSCGLEVLGVAAPAALGGAAFKAQHPDPAAWADLDLWDAFEQSHPQVFAQMISVWCRPV